MKTIKIILNDDGSVLSLSCGFQLNQYSYNDTLLNVYVPSNILENQTDLEDVDYSNNVVMGMYYTLANGSQKVGNPYYFTFVKDNVVIDNKLYTLYERKMPKEFTLYYGTQTYSINVVALKTTINNGVATNEVIGNITSNNFELNIVRAMNMVDDGIEEDTDLSTLIANVNSLLSQIALKQDKSDVLIQVSIANGSNVKTSIVREALNVLNQRVAENYTNVTTNTGDITQLKQDVIDINNQLLTSFRYCGSYTSPNPPTNPNLNQLMTTWGLTARNGDVIIWTWVKSGATDKSYTCRYNVNNTWDTIEIPTVETASNTDAGLIQGNYDDSLTPSDTTPNILASIVGGKIVDIYYKRGGIYHNLQIDFNGIVAELNGLLALGTETAIKSQYATYDMSEYGSNNPTPINDKYMTKSEGATKQFVTDYALPKTFNDIYRFDFTNNKLVSNSVNTNKTLATQLGSVDFGSYTIEKSDVLTFELSNKNTFSCNFYAMFDNNIDDVTFTMIIKADTTPIASTTSETTDFTGGTYKKVSINGDFALLGDSEITIDENVTLSVELSANITTSATNNLTIYSNTTLPSAFTLNVASSTIIINGSGVLGGVNYHTLNGVKTNNEIDFALPSNTTLVDATLHTFILNYSGITIGTNTMLYITNGNVRHNINLPTNYNSGATLSYGNVSQFLAPNSKIVFTAIYENGFFTIIGGNTLSSTQIQALLNAKQNVIDSSHKLDADLVAENSSRVFVTPTQKQQIGTNASDISSLDGRVTNLENNPTSNVSGTNDGTNWTTITIGNDTYAIPSGSSSGGSEKVYEFELTTNIYDGSSGVNTPSGAWNKINAVITETQFNELLTNINTAMSTSFTTPQEIIALYDSLKRDDFINDMQTFYLLNGLIAYVCHYAIEREKPAIRTCWNGTNEDMKMVITNASVMTNGAGSIHHQYYSANVQPFTNNYFDTNFDGDISKMAFDTYSTLTITEKYETIGGGNGGIDIDAIQNQITDLDSRVTTLENSGGSELYEHHIRLQQASNQYDYRCICFTLTCSTPSFTKSTLFTYLTTNLLNAVISATGYQGSQVYPSYENIVYAIRPQSDSLTVDILGNYQHSGYDTVKTTAYSSSAYNHSSTTLTDTVIKIS